MATTSEASRLQRWMNVMRFTWITVGLLAMLGSACGVGVDDPEGQQAAAAAANQNQQALVTGPDGTPVNPEDIPVVEGSGPVDTGISSLPSDPIPWQSPVDDDGRPLPPGP